MRIINESDLIAYFHIALVKAVEFNELVNTIHDEMDILKQVIVREFRAEMKLRGLRSMDWEILMAPTRKKVEEDRFLVEVHAGLLDRKGLDLPVTIQFMDKYYRL